ncbi:phosphoglycerate mutase-like protein [Hyaloscypha variabilis]
MASSLPPSTSFAARSASDSQPIPQPRLVLVQHGKPEVQEDIQHSLWPLSESGRDATASLAEKLRAFNFNKISSSPELKASGTAEILANKLKLEVEIDKDLAEHARHSMTFLPQAEFQDKIAQLFSNPSKLVLGEETADEAFERFDRALNKALVEADGRDVLVVTHGTVLSIYVSRRLGIDPLSFWRSLATPMAIVISGKEIEIIRAS